jgi:hypothetical protein
MLFRGRRCRLPCRGQADVFCYQAQAGKSFTTIRPQTYSSARAVEELPMKLSEFNFGEYDARREFLRDENYFIRTFIDPISFPLSTLSNRTNYIIVGQKGAGKTACQLFLENDKAGKQGYLSGLISFYDDLTPDDYKDFASTQRINLVSLEQLTSIETQYDFKEIWKRVLFIRIAKMLKAEGFDNSFIEFCLSSTGGTNSIIDGIKRSLKIEIKIPLKILEAKLKFDPSKLKEASELSISEFNRIAEELLLQFATRNSDEAKRSRPRDKQNNGWQ